MAEDWLAPPYRFHSDPCQNSIKNVTNLSAASPRRPTPATSLVSTGGVRLEAEEDVGDAVGVGLAVAVGVDARDEGGEGRFAVGGERGGRNDEEPLGVPGRAADEARAVERVVGGVFVLFVVVGAEARVLADARAKVVAARGAVEERGPVRVVELRGANRVGRGDGLVHDPPREDGVAVAHGAHPVFAHGDEVDGRCAGEVLVVVALEVDAGGGDVRGEVGRVERGIAAREFVAEEVVALRDERRERDDESRFLPGRGAGERLAVVRELGQLVEVLDEALAERGLPGLVALFVVVDAEEVVAQGEPGGVGLRVVDAEPRLEDEPVLVHLGEDGGEAAVALRGVGGDERVAVVVEFAQGARADDAGEEGVAALAVGGEKACLVVVGLRGEVGVALRELELRVVAREGVVAREAEEHVAVARLGENVDGLLAGERALVDDALGLGDDGLDGALGGEELDVGVAAFAGGGVNFACGGVDVVVPTVKARDVVHRDAEDLLGDIKAGLNPVSDDKGVLGGEETLYLFVR